MMRKTLFVLLSLALAFPSVNTARAVDKFCICPLVPFYPVGGGNYFHYATVCKQGDPGCIHQYPTGHICPATYGASCSNTKNGCINCSDLGEEAKVPETLYFGVKDAVAPTYADLDQPDEFRQFLVTVGGTASKDVYDNCTFLRPRPLEYDKPVAVKLPRGKSYFHAIVYRIRGDAVMARGTMGIEISGVIPNEVEVTPYSVCAAVCTSKNAKDDIIHAPIEGLLQIQLFDDKDEVLFVRLQDSTENRNAAAEYKACHP